MLVPRVATLRDRSSSREDAQLRRLGGYIYSWPFVARSCFLDVPSPLKAELFHIASLETMTLSAAVLAASFFAARVLAQAQPLTGVFIPSNYTYLLPVPYTGNLSLNFIDTNTSSGSLNSLLSHARKSHYVFYDAEFLAILGSNPTIELVPNSTRSVDYAYEAGVYLSDHNQVWFTGSITSLQPDGFSILDLNKLTISTPDVAISQGPNLNGGYYYNGLVYFTASGNLSDGSQPAVYSVDPTTFKTTTIVNSYFGLPINSIDDMVWTSCPASGPTMFFTSVWFGSYSIPGLETPVLPNAVYKFSHSTSSLTPAISRADILIPNGVRSSLDGKYLYVTDTASRITGSGPANYSSGSAGIFRFTLDDDCNPTNKVFFGLTRSGVSDGIHVDAAGRVWTGEYDGIVVRNPRGKVLGVFNAETLLDQPYGTKIANFALAGDKLIVLAADRIFVVKLGIVLS